MLISGIGEDILEGEGQGASQERVHDHELQTADELFGLMTNDCGFGVNDGEGLTTRDLVLLYQNIDVGTKLINKEHEVRKPNQYVETIVYNEEEDSNSDISDEDIPNVFNINQERLNLLGNGSFDHILCHKLGGLQIQMSDINTRYDKQFIFKDPYIKEHLKNILEVNSNDFKSVLPTSLLDYICCKRLEDNYNFYMDNIITYVQRTIEQLKKISNGDYLTDKTKEKWREVTAKCSQEISTLSTANSIPLRGSMKANIGTWNDIVHSAIDVRSLSKILKKKIVIEIPKLICGSFRVFSHRCADNLIISCKKEKKINKKKDEVVNGPRLDVVLQFKRSETGQLTTKVSSVILQMKPDNPTKEPHAPEILPLQYKEEKEVEKDTENNGITTYYDMSNESTSKTTKDQVQDLVITEEVDEESCEETSYETNCTDSDCFGFYDVTVSSESSVPKQDTTNTPVSEKNPEVSYNHFSFDELRLTMHRLNNQTAVAEESSEDLTGPVNKRNSPQRVRVKSPYENKLFAMEEKKRKKFLEIRERREKKKQALSENCKITKNKYGKSYAPQPVNSVTKLSITNKSFYNSIYGQNLNLENKPSKTKARKSNKKENPLALDVSVEEVQNICDSPNVTPERYGKKYINRSYYLDEAETEMDMQMKQSENKEKQSCSASTSTINNDIHANINLLNQFIGPNNINNTQDLSCHDITQSESNSDRREIIDLNRARRTIKSPNKIRERSARKSSVVRNSHESKALPSTLECRKSIEKLYDLMKKSKKNNRDEFNNTPTKLGVSKTETSDSAIQDIRSGTSLSHQATFSNTSSTNVDKTDDKKPGPNDKNIEPTTVVPKVIISSKHALKIDTDKIKKDRRKPSPIVTKVIPENPLRAISQLLQEFDHVQKTRQRSTPDKGLKKEVVINDVRNINRPIKDGNFRRRSRIEQHLSTTREIEQDKSKFPHRERRTRPVPPTDIPKILHQQMSIEEKNLGSNIGKKKMMDIIEEVKEARGEAIRGPSKFLSRLNSLAQPKKAYVQAHSEDYQTKYGRNLMSDRLQRLAGATAPSKSDRFIGTVNSRLKPRRNGPEGVSNDASIKIGSASPHSPNTEKTFKPRPPNTISTIINRSSPRPPALSIHRGGLAGSPQQSPTRSILRSSPRSPSQSPRRSPNRKPSELIKGSPESPEVRNKMVKFESHIKTNDDDRSKPPLSTNSHQTEHKSRVPFVPKDIEMTIVTSPSPAEEANKLGSALHSMIQSMIDSTVHKDTFPENNSKINNVEHLLERETRTCSNFNNNVLKDTTLDTTVDILGSTNLENKPYLVSESHELNSLNSKTELEKLESALYNQISGAFQKRLRIKNLTLTPKQSMQKVYLLQSGDAGSLLFKSLTKIQINKCDADDLEDTKPMPVMVNENFNWDFMQIPAQQNTVGFALMSHISEKNESLNNITSVGIHNSSRLSSASSNKSDKVIQCFKGVPEDHLQENAVQVVVENEIPVNESGLFDASQSDLPKTEVEQTQHNPSETEQTSLEKRDKNDKEAMKPKSTQAVAKDDVEFDYIVKDSDVASMVESSVVDKDETFDIKSNNQKCLCNNVSEKSTNAEYTSSLDVLVGLLNEIQKITCDTHLGGSCTDLNAILNDAAAVEQRVAGDTQEPHASPSIEKLRKLDSKPSIFSLYISAKDWKWSSSQDMCFGINKSAYIDKEVNVNIVKETMPAFTEISSMIFPLTINHSTNITNSLIGVFSEPSSQSMCSFSDYNSLSSNKSLESQSVKNIKDITPKIIKENSKTSVKISHTNFKRLTPNNVAPVIHDHNSDISKFKISKFFENYNEFDPVLKMKRDILVTVYSLLVLTVFAALSFPELLVPI